MLVISGVTGNTGSIVADTLLAQGQAVRVLVRSAEKGLPWKAKGAEVAIADIDDLGAVTAALEGASGAYFLLPPDLTDEAFIDRSRKRAEILAEAARLARLPQAVVLSSVGAQYQDRVGPIATLSYLEDLFIKAGIPLSAVRPGYFFGNLKEMLPTVLEAGVYPSMVLPLDFKIDMVSAEDIGLAVAEALVNPTSEPHRVIELKGAARYSAIDVAAAFSKALGREILPVPVQPETWVDQLTQAGLPGQTAEAMAEMHENINNGRIDFVDPNARKGTVNLDDFVSRLVA
ncbi:MAG: NmrA family NAD(P)-binding protein [Magnetovibrionaceae bacterium]